MGPPARDTTLRVHRNGAVIMPANTKSKNGPVISNKPTSLIKEYLEGRQVDWLTVILVDRGRAAIIANSRKHCNYLLTRPRIRKAANRG